MDISKLTPAGKKNIKRINDGEVIYQNLLKMTENPMRYNEELLMKILDDNKNTEYGKRFDFENIHSIKEYQEKVPITEYDDYMPYIQRMIENEEDNLITVYEVDHYAKSSATIGKAKKIPFSLHSQKILIEYLNNYTYNLLSKKLGHGWVDGKSLNLLEMSLEKLENGKTYGPMSVKFMYQYKDYIELFFTSPQEAFFHSADTNTRYLHSRFALMDKNFTLMQATFLNLFLEVLRYIEHNWELIVNDIEKGTIDESIKLSDSERESLSKKLKPMPERAQELRKIFEEGFDTPIIPRLWPNLQVIVGIGTGGFDNYTQKIKEKYADENLDFCFIGLVSSEGMFTAPIELNSPSFSLIPDSVFFEFRPIETEDSSKYLTLDKLEVGKEYELVITNLSGLYRYRMQDVVKVSEKYNEMPLVEFLYRLNQYADLNGEKTTEYILRKSLYETEKELGFDLYEYFMIPDGDSLPYKYLFFMEAANVPQGITIKHIRDSIDKNLSKNNPSYGHDLEKEIFAKSQLRLLKPETFLLYKDYIIKQGASNIQLKPPRIVIDETHIEFFKTLLD